MGSTSSAPLYEQLADRVESLIASGTLRAGERLESVRRMSQKQGVSVSTVLQAYRRLEDRGLIEARPKSGYFVRRAPRRLPAPERSAPVCEPRVVDAVDLAMRISKDASCDDMVHLGSAVPGAAMLPLESLHRRLSAIGRRDGVWAVQYEETAGNRELRVQVARRALDAGCALSPDDLLITNGAFEGIHLCLRAVTKPGDTVIVESPTHYVFLQMLEVMGLRALEVATDPVTGIDLDALEAALDHQQVAACLLMTTLHNPLGSSMPGAALRRLVKLLDQRGVPLIEDDVWGELAFADSRPKVAKAFDRTGNVMLVSSASKTMCPSYRIGWVAAGRWQAEVFRQKLVTSFCSPLLAQLTIADFLADGGFDRYLRRARTTYRQQVRRAADTVVRSFPSGTRLTDPRGGIVLWIELPEAVDSMELYRRAHDARVAIAPGPAFSSQPRYNHFIRLSVGEPWTDDIEAGIETVGELAGELATA